MITLLTQCQSSGRAADRSTRAGLESGDRSRARRPPKLAGRTLYLMLGSSLILTAGLLLLCCSPGVKGNSHGHQHSANPRHSLKAITQATGEWNHEAAEVKATGTTGNGSLCVKTTVLSFVDPVAAEQASKKGWLTPHDWGNELRKIDGSQHKTVRVGVDGFPCAKGCCQHEMTIRTTGSDSYVLQHAITELSGALSQLGAFRPRAILDAGGNIGVATLLVASLYPDATVVALEPESENCKLLRQNTAAFPNVRVHCLGLWNAAGRAAALLPGKNSLSWSWKLAEVAPGSEGAVRTTAVPALLQELGLPAFDLVKMDIEGAEYTVLGEAADRSWLEGTQVLLGEIHDDRGDGAALRARLRQAGFQSGKSGEYDTFRRPSVPLAGR